MHWFRILVVPIVGVLLICHGNCQVRARKNVQKRGVMDNFNDGLKFAGQMFGINTAADVANLVAKAFSTTTSRRKPDFMSIFQQNQQQSSAEEPDSQQQPTSTSQEEEQKAAQYETQQSQRGHGQVVPPTPTQSTLTKEDFGGIDFDTTKLITSVLRMIGFDASKLGALAINALIMVAQAIGNTLMSNNKSKRADAGNRFPGSSSSTEQPGGAPDAFNPQNAHQPRELRDGSPIDWFLQNSNKDMKRLLKRMTDADLSDKVTGMIEKLEIEGGEGACLKMLMCKSSPFIWGMQKSLNKRFGSASKNASKEDKEQPQEENADADADVLSTRGFFRHLPSVSEFREHGEQCEQRYASHCNTTSLYDRKS